MVTIDISEVQALTRKARRLFRAMPRRMLRIGQFAAKYERSTHPYTNRTGRLEASTEATMDGDTLTLSMGMHYASYVNDLGYSNIGEAAAMVDQQLTAGFDAMADELSG